MSFVNRDMEMRYINFKYIDKLILLNRLVSGDIYLWLRGFGYKRVEINFNRKMFFE